MKKRAREVIRFALLHAIDERESFLDSISACDWPEMNATRAETEAWISAMRAMLKRRYDEKPLSEIDMGKPTIGLADIWNLPDQEFRVARR